MKEKKHCSAIVLAAGSGKRMNSDTKKQYMLIYDKPVIYYSLKAFQESFVDEIVLVVSPGDVSYCQKEIVEKYGFTKVSKIIEGGKERYHSVAAGLKSVAKEGFVFIHDGARPMITEDILERALTCVEACNACVVGMPVKDTIKIAGADKNIAETPNRNLVWMVQTPQVFEYNLIKDAYEELLVNEQQLLAQGISVTDDAMVVETLSGQKVKLVEGSYENIKITTPEDIPLAECFLKAGNEK